MRTLFFTTGTRDCEKLWRSYQNLYPDTSVVRYDVAGLDMVAVAREYRPDVIVYVGAIGDFHFGLPVPTTDVLARVGAVAPMVHLCSDAADPPWWDILREYHAHGVFALQVSIDGSHDSPIATEFGNRGRVALTPIDPGMFSPRPWSERIFECGFAGGGGCRTESIRSLRHVGVPLTWLGAGSEVTYPELCDFYCDCRVVWNDARTGSGARRHVKGRAVEAGLAGAVLVEPSDSPLSRWFTPGEDYLVYSTISEARDTILDALAPLWNGARMAERFHRKMVERHAASVFWSDALSHVLAGRAAA